MTVPQKADKAISAQETAQEFARKRVRVRSPDAARLVTVTSDYSLPGVRWNYYNTVYGLLDFAGSWPRGMAAHIAWPDAGQWRVLGLWSDQDAVEEFFGAVTIERISQAIQLLGVVQSAEGATDVEPERHAVRNLILGPLARSFVDIGQDRDGAAVNALDTEPIAMQLEVSGMDAAAYVDVLERLGYDREIPADLIAHFAADEDGGMRIFEIWSTSGHALATLGDKLLPAIEQIANERGVELICDHSTLELRRILFGDAIVSAFGF